MKLMPTRASQKMDLIVMAGVLGLLAYYLLRTPRETTLAALGASIKRLNKSKGWAGTGKKSSKLYNPRALDRINKRYQQARDKRVKK